MSDLSRDNANILRPDKRFRIFIVSADNLFIASAHTSPRWVKWCFAKQDNYISLSAYYIKMSRCFLFEIYKGF
jgi:hypothetical protein